MLTTLWVQKNLNFLGYNSGIPDNIKRSITTKAIKDFQNDFNLDVDGIAGEKTSEVLIKVIKKCQEILGVKQDGLAGDITNKAYNDFNNIKHFKYSEFTCKCGCRTNNIDIRLVYLLDKIREKYNSPCIITSGVRCVSHNKKVGGSQGSWHTKRKAVDFYVKGVKVTELLSYCIDLRNQGLIRYTYTNNSSMNGVVHIDIGGII